MFPKFHPSAILFAFIALTSVTAQTFQYSRGWTNGKRDGHNKRLDTSMREIANNLEKTLTPCQLNKLKYVLEGRPFTERLFGPCKYLDEDGETQPQSQQRQYQSEHTQDPLFEAFL